MMRDNRRKETEVVQIAHNGPPFRHRVTAARLVRCGSMSFGSQFRLTA
jgi:hypothetical protein